MAVCCSRMKLFFALSMVLLLLRSAGSVSFKYSRFDSNTQGILYQGDVGPSLGAIDFIDVDYLCRVGWAIFGEIVPLWDDETGKTTDFSTHFVFSIDTLGASNYGHGLAFFLAPVGFQIPPNSNGGFLGLFNSSGTVNGSSQVVHVEFDSYSNPQWDPKFEHVGINKNSLSSLTFTPWNASLHSGDNADVWISYNSTTKNLSVSWSYQTASNSSETAHLNAVIDLMEVLPQWVTVGFSAATGMYVEKHTIKTWEFNSTLEMKKTVERKSKKEIIVWSVTASGVFIAVSIIALVLVLWRLKMKKKRKAKSDLNMTSINDDLERGAGPRRFSLEDLVMATNNFAKERKLGQGGFGSVYRGYFADMDLSVAVKKISRNSKQGKKEYLTEVKIISRLRHRNLVKLVGWCHDKGEFLLVYEFMPNGSLDSHLFGRRSSLPWSVRYKISLGLASALLYLHEEWEQCVVHRDIKSSNVMLDSNYNVKLGDFGLAKLMDHELGPQTTGLAGTLGYLAPEYISTGRASKESDVFSFGVVAMEIATGRKSVSITKDCDQSLVAWVWDLYGKGDHLSAVDGGMRSNFNEKEVERLMIVGLWCAYPDEKLRPTIRQAIQVLNFETTMPILPRSMPVATYQPPSSSTPPSADGRSAEPSIDTSLAVGR